MNDSGALSLLRSMKRIRRVEEEIANRYTDGLMRCPTHLSIGQEAVGAAVGLALKTSDLAVSGHRAHAHYLGKGGDLNAMLAEIHGKSTGCAGGKGGSMHLVDEAVGFMGSTAIVGGTVPVGVGLAYGIRLRRTTQLSCIFIGEAVTETGVFYESVNFAVLKKLPVLFICENNLYSVYSPLSVRQPQGRRIHEMVAAMGVPAIHSDGNDAIGTFELVCDLAEQVRGGAGPRFAEFTTYRWREHCGPFYDNDLGYRTEQEFLEWKARDPIERLEKQLMARGVLTAESASSDNASIASEVDAGFEFAISSAFPQPDAAFTDLYCEDRISGVQTR
jgi:pyruvate dehydrogenase E1 component alpha subunit